MQQTTQVEFRHFHLFAGLGGAAKGFNEGHARVGQLEAKWRCIGGIDVDANAMRDFQTLAGVPGTCMDLFDRDQYVAFHGCQPPADWKEATPDDIRRAAGYETPSAIVLSPPCKGFSGLLSEQKSLTTKYQALNRLTIRGMWLALEAWRNDLPELILLENVPRLANRGRGLVDQIKGLLQSYGYAVAETTHDCGELAGLAQSRKRFLLVARNTSKVAPLLYEPQKMPLRAVGEVLGKMLLPGDATAGPMHRIPSLAWKTWTRLAFVKAGSDWRSLNELKVVDGKLADYMLVPEGTTAQPGGVDVDDVRFSASSKWKDGQAYGVRKWSENMGTVAGQQSPGQGSYCVADPRPTGQIFGKYAVVKWDRAAGTVISGSTTGQGAFAVADPRSGMEADREAYLSGGHYGVIPWDAPTGAVSGAACHDNGRWSIADPRLPGADDKLVAIIRAIDGTWHRPFTTLELAAIQSLYDPEQHLIDREIAVWETQTGKLAHSMHQFMLAGSSDSDWRERIGNAIPPASAKAIASEMGRTLLLAFSGETFQLSSVPIWVRPVAMAMSVSHT